MKLQYFLDVWNMIIRKRGARIFTLGLLFILFCAPQIVFARAWWGEGYRSPEWVVANGGTILYYDCSNRRGDVTVDLYTANGAVIETERGKSGIFDDGLAGAGYYLKAKDKKDKFKSAVFTMKRGSTNYVTLDFKEEEATFSFGATTGILGLQTPRPKVIQKEEPKEEEREVVEESKEEIIEEVLEPKNTEVLDLTSNGGIPQYDPNGNIAKTKMKKMAGVDNADKLSSIFDISVLAMIFILGGSMIFASNFGKEPKEKWGEKKAEKSEKEEDSEK